MPRPLIAIIIFALALSAGIFFVWPKYQSLTALRAEVEQKRIELNSKNDYYSKIKDTSAELEKYQAQLAKISSALPDIASLPSLFNFLQKSSADAGLLLEDIGLGSTQLSGAKDGEGGIREININLELSGSYPALKSFLSAIEKSARLFAVKNISFDSPEDPGDPFFFKISVAVNSY